MSDRLHQLMSLELRDGPLLILTHENPDPDSLSSAVALRHLLETERNVQCTVAYSGIVGRAENRTMIETLQLDLSPLDSLDLESFAHVALIDAQPFTGNSAFREGRVPDIIIDHHPLRETTRRARFFDVRENYGASATILTEYLRESQVDIPSDLATALAYGIQSETQDLTRETSNADRAAFQFLLPLADGEKLALIARPRLEPRYYVQMSEALDALLVGEGIAICPLDEVIDPDFVPEMADFVVRMNGVNWVLVYGYFGDRMYLSIRTDDRNANAGDVMQHLVAGIGFGGGHGMRAGGNIAAPADDDRRFVEAELRNRFLQLRGYHGELHSLDEM